MPFILICGYPSAGKTTYSFQLKHYFQQKHNKEVILINEENLFMVKNQVYSDTVNEKMMRGQLRSQVDKFIDNSKIIILDSLNYIKGFRYELFCLVRGAKTTHCVIFIDNSLQNCLQYRESKLQSEHNLFQSTQNDPNTQTNQVINAFNKEYDPQQVGQFCSQMNNVTFNEDMLADLYNRMEIPNSKNRWDSPLFVIQHKQPLPFEAIEKIILFEPKKSKNPVSTQRERVFDESFLQDLDQKLVQIIQYIVENQNESISLGGALKIAGQESSLNLSQTINPIQLKMYKKEYISICKKNPPKNVQAAGEHFIVYIQQAIKR